MKAKNNILWYVRIVVPICIFIVIAWLMMHGKLSGFDAAVRQAFFALRRPWLNKLVVPFTRSGNWPLPVAVCLLLLLIPKTRFSFGIPLSITALPCVLLYMALKNIICRPRPDVLMFLMPQGGYSFPSGHSLNNLVIWTMMVLLIAYYYKHQGASLPLYEKFKKKSSHPAEVYLRSKGVCILVCTLMMLYAILMGLSRIYTGVHWPSDVLASWVLGFAILNIMYMVNFMPPKKEEKA